MSKKLGFISCGASGRLFSGAVLAGMVEERKNWLRKLGCHKGSCVALVQQNEAEFFVNLFALWELGACAVPLAPTLTPSEVESAVAHSGASLVWRQGSFSEAAITGEPPPSGTALLLYTSGSTGAPRGVKISHNALKAKLDVLRELFSDEDLSRALCLIPVSFGHGLIGNSLPALWSGGTLHLEAAYSQKLALDLGAYIDAHEITFLSSVPALWKSVLPFASRPKGASLRMVFCASADLSVAAAEEIQAWIGAGVKFKNVYGITEAASWIAGLPDGAQYLESGSFGRGWGCEIKVDPATGEILVRAPYLMDGYHRDASATNTALRGGWLHTGDFGELKESGDLLLRGRIKDQINRGGQKINPVEVEERLCLFPGVKEASVFSLPDEVSGELVAAALVFEPGEEPDTHKLRAFCRESLSEYKVPGKFFFPAALPRTSRGKVDKSKLVSTYREGNEKPR